MSNNVVKQQDASPSSLPARDQRALLPPVDVIEDASGITVYADLPGVSRERLDLRVEGDMLTIEGELALALPTDMQASHAEIEQARYRRSFALSEELDAEQIRAELSQGLLRLRIPKAEHARPRRIAVAAG